MNMRLMYITNDTNIGKIAQDAGVDWIFVDLEFIGKENRQANRNTVISSHTINDIIEMKKIINESKLLVRVNPIGEWSKKEIEATIEAGADIIMLPYFKSAREVEIFLNIVNKRVETCLLCETMDALNDIDNILMLDGIDYIHIGFNDLHIERKTTFMFEFLSDGSMDKLAKKIHNKNIPFGFGGMARIGELMPPAEHILTEHYRLGSTGVILARSFCNAKDFKNIGDFEKYFRYGVQNIREYEAKLIDKDNKFYEENRLIVNQEILDVVRGKN